MLYRLLRPFQLLSASARTALLRLRHVQVAGTPTYYGKQIIALYGTGKLVLGRNVTLCENVQITVYNGGSLTIGDNSVIKRNCSLNVAGQMTIGQNALFVDGVMVHCGGHISVGSDCMLAAYTLITDVNHEFQRTDIPMQQQGLTTPQPVHIADDVWLGSKVTVLPGCNIGRGAIIGANAVVSKDVPEYAIAGGIPAKTLRFRQHSQMQEKAIL